MGVLILSVSMCTVLWSDTLVATTPLLSWPLGLAELDAWWFLEIRVLYTEQLLSKSSVVPSVSSLINHARSWPPCRSIPVILLKLRLDRDGGSIPEATVTIYCSIMSASGNITTYIQHFYQNRSLAPTTFPVAIGFLATRDHAAM